MRSTGTMIYIATRDLTASLGAVTLLGGPVAIGGTRSNGEAMQAGEIAPGETVMARHILNENTGQDMLRATTPKKHIEPVAGLLLNSTAPSTCRRPLLFRRKGR